MKSENRREIKAELARTCQRFVCNDDISDEKFVISLQESVQKIDDLLVQWRGTGLVLKKKVRSQDVESQVNLKRTPKVTTGPLIELDSAEGFSRSSNDSLHLPLACKHAPQLFNFQKLLVKFNHETTDFFNHRITCELLLQKLQDLHAEFQSSCMDFQRVIAQLKRGLPKDKI